MSPFIRCQGCGRPLPAGAFSQPNAADFCSVRCAREKGATTEVIARLEREGRLQPRD